MLPYLIAGAIGYGIAKLFEEDKASKFADGGQLKYKNKGAYADVTKLNKNEWYLNMIEAEIEGKGYAQKIMNQIIQDAKNKKVIIVKGQIVFIIPFGSKFSIKFFYFVLCGFLCFKKF